MSIIVTGSLQITGSLQTGPSIIQRGLISYWDAANINSNATASFNTTNVNLPTSSYLWKDMIGVENIYFVKNSRYDLSTGRGPGIFGTWASPFTATWQTRVFTGSLATRMPAMTLEVIGSYAGSAQTSGFFSRGANSSIGNVYYPTQSARVSGLDYALMPLNGTVNGYPNIASIAFQCRVTCSLGIKVLTALAFDTGSNPNCLNLRNRLTHYTVTFDGNRIRLFLDGKEDASEYPFNPTYMSSTEGLIYVKSLPPGISGSLLNGVQYFNNAKSSYGGGGYVNIIRVYDNAFTTDEVLQNYNATKRNT
jgi:hypothetical protein